MPEKFKTIQEWEKELKKFKREEEFNWEYCMREQKIKLLKKVLKLLPKNCCLRCEKRMRKAITGEEI